MKQTGSTTVLVLTIACAIAFAGCMSDTPKPAANQNGPGQDGSGDGSTPSGSGSSPGSSQGPGAAPGSSQGPGATTAGSSGGTGSGGSGSGGGGSVGANGPAAVDLRSAGSYAILTKAGVSTTGTTTIVGDVGVSPIDATAITGFGLVMDSSNQFATSSLITGQVRAADYAPPTPTAMTQAVADMETAYADAMGRTNPTATELGAGNIGGMTIAPGLYKWGTGVTIPSDVVLAGGSNDVWIFQIAQGLDLGTGAEIKLSGGAQARNVFWQVAQQATLATGSDFKGTILSYTAIVLETGATLNGRALAQTAVTLDANAVTRAA